ncbi:peptidase domain-containing ABC transporter [Candidatus Uabimicrobium sp. HlEnr_7]|uniref:peptidase domain-containing ABC transporter n=1 Tax=Candidatus Uabimicrobium helgolandensis TaxID=3095367 RepID=UPI003555D7AA
MNNIDIKNFLSTIDLFSCFSTDFLSKIAKKVEIVNFKIGENIVEKGDEEENLYVIFSGKARVIKHGANEKPTTIDRLVKGDSFGENSFLESKTVENSIRTSSKTVLIKISNKNSKLLFEKSQAFRKKLEAKVRSVTQLHFLKSLKFFSHLPQQQMKKLLRQVHMQKLEKNEYLFHEGDESNAFYILYEGELDVIKESAANTLLASLKKGDILGEIAMLENQPRSAGIKATSFATVMLFSQEVYQYFIATEKKSRDLLFETSKIKILQNKSILNEDQDDKLVIEELHVQNIKLKSSKKAFPFVSIKSEITAGIACIAMLDSFYKEPHDLSLLLEKQVLYQQPDSLLSLNHKLESCGYLTRMLTTDGSSLSTIPLPAIYELDNNVQGIIFKVVNNKVLVAEPCDGLRYLSIDEFCDVASGEILSVFRVPEIKNGKYTQFFKYLYREIIYSVTTISVFLQILALVSPLFLQLIIDKVLVYNDRSLFTLMVCSMATVVIFELLGGLIRSFVILHAFFRFNSMFMIRLFQRLLAAKYTDFLKWTVGDYLQRFNENGRLLHLISNSGYRIIIDSITVVLYFAVMCYLSLHLAAITCISVLMFSIIFFTTLPKLKKYNRVLFEQRTELQDSLVEVFSGMMTIKGLSAKNYFLNNGLQKIFDHKKEVIQRKQLILNIALCSDLVQKLSVITILGYGASLVIQAGDDAISVGTLLSFTATLGLLMSSLNSLTTVIDEMSEIKIALDKTMDVLQMSPERDSSHSTLMFDIKGDIRFENVCFRYSQNSNNILSNINLEIYAGEKIAIVGRSGSGKTTLINLVIKLLQPSSGSIYLDNHDLSNISPVELRQQLGVIEQNPYFFSGTIRENIAHTDPNAHIDKVIACAVKSGSHNFIDKLPLGYETPIGERGLSLSGGERQRLAIARALFHTPKLLILDEATSSLDSETENIVYKNIIATNCTTIIIAHRLHTIHNADRIVVIDNGKITEVGTHRELMNNGKMYSKWNQ